MQNCYNSTYLFLSVQTLSYNGKLTFKVAQEVAGGLSLSGRGGESPVVVLMGNYKLRLSYESVKPMTYGRVHEFSVTLREVRGTCDSDCVNAALRVKCQWLVKPLDSHEFLRPCHILLFGAFSHMIKVISFSRPNVIRSTVAEQRGSILVDGFDYVFIVFHNKNTIVTFFF